MYSNELKYEMLKAVRDEVSRHICSTPMDDAVDLSRYQELHEVRGVFVTLKQNGRLRGCIGTMAGSGPLYEELMRTAVEAALHDPRFPPMTCEELPITKFEISVLSPLRKIDSYQEIILGHHGILLTLNVHRSLFLPQVALEQQWNIEETLSHLALKAGLPADAWRQPSCILHVFEAEVFGEE